MRITSPLQAPFVVIVVLNWNAWQETTKCVADLLRLDYPRYRIMVVDNGSRDGSVEQLRAAFPELQVIEAGGNRGFGGGTNLGMRYALTEGADLIWVVNNDTDISPGCLSSLVSVLERNPSAGIIGPTVVSRSEGRPEPLNRFPPGVSRPSVPAAVAPADLECLDTAPGAAMLLRRGVLDLLGGFDERYFHYFEDTDLCWRAWRAGWWVGRTAACTIGHGYATSTRGARPMELYYMVRNILMFVSRASGLPVTVVLFRHPRVWTWALGPLFGLRSFRRPAVKLAVLRAVRDAVVGRVGRSPTYSPP